MVTFGTASPTSPTHAHCLDMFRNGHSATVWQSFWPGPTRGRSTLTGTNGLWRSCAKEACCMPKTDRFRYREETVRLPALACPGKIGVVTVTFGSGSVLPDFLQSL